MKRDKVWLKEKLNTEKYYRETNELKAKTTYGELYDRGVRDGINVALEFIEQIDEPKMKLTDVFKRLGELEENNRLIWIRSIAKKYKVEISESEYSFGYEQGKVDGVAELQESYALLKKPVIPQFVAYYIENNKGKEFSLGTWLNFVNLEYGFESETEEWLYSGSYEEQMRREYLLVDAIRYGYQVEKEKNYEVTVGKGTWGGHTSVVVLYKSVGKTIVLREMSEEYYEDSKRKAPTSFWLTEKEIKDYDKRYWVFAEEVTE